MPAAEPDIPTKIFVGNLSLDTDEKKLGTYFSKMGKISEVLLMRDKETNVSRGFGFITYENPSDAKDAVGRFSDTDLDGKLLRVSMALKGIKQQISASRGGGPGRGGMMMDRGRGGFRGRGAPMGGRGGGHYSYSMERPLLSGPPGRGGPGGLGGPPGRGGPLGRGGPPGRGGPLRGGPSRGSPYPPRGGGPPRGGPPDRGMMHHGEDDYLRVGSTAPRSAPPRSGKEPLLSAPPASAMGDFRPRGYERGGYEREADGRRDHPPRSGYDAEEPHVEPRRRGYPEEDFGAAPAAARPARSGYDEAAPDPYSRERFPPAREEPRRAYPEREGYANREARDPYAPPARDSYSTAAASRPTYDYSLPPGREVPGPPPPAPPREFLPATARTGSRFDDGRGAPPARDYERVPVREYGAERAEAGYGRDYEREPASRNQYGGEQYPRTPARAAEREYGGSSSAAPRYDSYASREPYGDSRSARPADKAPYGARDSYGSPSAAGGRGAYPSAERASRPLDRNGGGVPPPARAPPSSRGYERY
ncbi:uncharacterized protein [Asterias amurensis]|uniref:uncharacterized protein n=1 Tax=Asterias amurensis TaxID=7602 RepID=UPI003AB4A496